MVESAKPSPRNSKVNCLLAALFIILTVVLIVAIYFIRLARSFETDSAGAVESAVARMRHYDETSTAMSQQNLGTRVSVYMTRTAQAEPAITETAIREMGMIPQQFTATAFIGGVTQTGAAELGTFEPTPTPNALQHTATAIIGETATVEAAFGTSTSIPTLLPHQETATAIIVHPSQTAEAQLRPTLLEQQRTATAIIYGATLTATHYTATPPIPPATYQPDLSAQLVTLGEYQLRDGLIAEAIESFEQALRLDPNNRAARHALNLIRFGGWMTENY
jgi:tetratricopeptide (TPR) repeat protein